METMSTSEKSTQTPDSENATLQPDELPNKRVKRSPSNSSQSSTTESDSDSSDDELWTPEVASKGLNDALNEFKDVIKSYTS